MRNPVILFVFSIFVGHPFLFGMIVGNTEPPNGQEEEKPYHELHQLRGDPEDLTPLHPSHYFATPYRPKSTEPPPIPPKKWLKYVPKKGESGDLVVAGTRHNPRRQSYSRNYNPKPRHYSHQNRHSDGGKNNKGGYSNSDSYQGKNGYSTYSSYDRANKDNYADSDHQQYGNKDGGHHGGGHSGGHKSGGGGGSGGHYGGYGGEYGDNGNSYTSSSDEY